MFSFPKSLIALVGMTSDAANAVGTLAWLPEDWATTVLHPTTPVGH